MRACFIGCVAASLPALETLAALNEIHLAGVVTREASPFNADHVNLRPFCEEHGIPWIYAGPRLEGAALAFLREARPEVIFCLGWSSLLSKEILAAAPLGVVGFHPSPLPFGRGRHPLIWALALGLNRTASTFFFMDEGADSGDIISQAPVEISPEDTAATLYARVMRTAREQLRDFAPALARGTAPRLPQDHSQATYWRKRDKRDGTIDFRMTAEAVYNLVRALSPPYPGAQAVYKNREYKVWDAAVAGCDDRRHEPGKVLEARGREVTVKCGLDAIVLRRHEIPDPPEPGGYLL